MKRSVCWQVSWAPGLQGVLSREAPQPGAHGPVGRRRVWDGRGRLPAWVLTDDEVRLRLGPSGAFIFS